MSFRVMHSTIGGVRYFYRTLPFTLLLVFGYALLQTWFSLFINAFLGGPINISIADGVLLTLVSWGDMMLALGGSSVGLLMGGYLARIWWGKYLRYDEDSSAQPNGFSKAMVFLICIFLIFWGVMVGAAKLGFPDISVGIQYAFFGLIFLCFAGFLKLPFSVHAKTKSIWKELNLGVLRHSIPMCFSCILGGIIGVLPISLSLGGIEWLLSRLFESASPSITNFMDLLTSGNIGLLYAAIIANYLCDLEPRFSLVKKPRENREGGLYPQQYG
ncbi:hypothetical protein KFE96_06085 [Kordiimonas sp. SCSIO 12603]|uniref:hypothetical protein n=1 Tax=Kordiimonas sp. SCSIO 12603 TaxID=2829596 RepID=UPI0021046A3E|nr:hypothetical protein [Kordiimonas sp. SCSIO 12603]UTW59871.1 hypothetical protein KFE96_06085 [Kordiimonas sp. SCSIO 12603]